MEIGRDHHKILIIGEEPSTRVTVRLLLGSMGCHCLVAPSVRQALTLLEQERPEAAVIDPKATDSSASHVLSGLDKLYQALRGRIVLLTGDVRDPDVREAVERYSLTRVPRDRLIQELWGALEPLLRPKSVFHRVTLFARLIFDSFFHPMPAGLRDSQPCARRLVYESGSLIADLCLEPQTDSQRIALVGQIVDSTRQDRSLVRIPVLLHGRKGLIALATTNEFGEFHLDFDFEPSVTLEMETGGDQRVSIILPSLERVASRASAGS